MQAESQSQLPHFYYFGDFRLDASRRLLFARASQDPLPVTPKVIAALLLFIQRRGELLTKDQLMANLWPGRVVEENSLTQLISVLRHILDEEPGENRYIATVPGFGYRFIADVREHDDVPEPPSTLTDSSPSPTSGRPRYALVMALTGIVASIFLVYTWLVHWSPTDEILTTVPQGSELPSRTVAVLPFESTEDANAYLAFGMAESVLHRLANVPNLTVIARTSSFVFRNRPADAREIGRLLNARYLLEGSLQRSGQRVRVTAQLVDAATGGHLWSLRFDRTLDDIFAVEDDIAKSVADALQVSLAEPRHPHARFGLEAYLSYLQGQALIATRRNDDAELAVRHFSQAVELAPDFAAAHAALAQAMWQVVLNMHTGGMGELNRLRTPEQRAQLAIGARSVQPVLERALELDETLAEAYVLRADLKAMDDPERAEADYRKGLSLNPNYSKGHSGLSILLYSLVGRERETLSEIDRAILLDPVQPEAYYIKGRYELMTAIDESGMETEGETYLRQALVHAPDYHPALLWLGVIRWHQGRFAEAARLAERAVAIDPRGEWMRRPLAEMYLDLGDVDAARSVLLDAPAPVPPVHWLAICLYEQKSVQAAALLRADPARDGFIDLDTPALALRDAALATNNPELGLGELLDLTRTDRPMPYARVTAAQLALASGNSAESARMARSLLEAAYIEQGFNRRVLTVPTAAALALLGEHDAALELLEADFRPGFRWRWWYTIDREPAFDAVRSDPRFQSLAKKAHAQADAERERLRQMRDRGQVPIRVANHAPGPEGC